MKEPTTKETLNSRFTKVLELLKDKGITQREIIDKIKTDIKIDEVYFSNLKSGKLKKISPELIDALHLHYNINPDYLRLESDCPFDNIEIQLEAFLKWVDDWNIVINGEDKFLHLTLDRNFYDFLLEFNRAEEITNEGFSSYEQEKKALKELYSAEANPAEFVLVPRNNFAEIVSEAVEIHKHINEILNLYEYSTYLEAKPLEKKSPKSKRQILKELYDSAKRSQNKTNT